MNFEQFRNTLLESFNVDKSTGVDVKINVNLLGDKDGKFSLIIQNNECIIEKTTIDKPDITVGFIDEDTMAEMFLKGANPVSLVMSGKMSFSGDTAKGKKLKGLFVN